jgi:hypothetical protein
MFWAVMLACKSDAACNCPRGPSVPHPCVPHSVQPACSYLLQIHAAQKDAWMTNIVSELAGEGSTCTYGADCL